MNLKFFKFYYPVAWVWCNCSKHVLKSTSLVTLIVQVHESTCISTFKSCVIRSWKLRSKVITAGSYRKPSLLILILLWTTTSHCFFDLTSFNTTSCAFSPVSLGLCFKVINFVFLPSQVWESLGTRVSQVICWQQIIFSLFMQQPTEKPQKG